MYTYSRRVRAEGSTLIWRNIDPDDRGKAQLALIVRLPEDSGVVKLTIQGLAPDRHATRDCGPMLPGEVVSVDLYDMVSISATADRDTVLECTVLPAAARP